jgi:hypothetical protein
MMKKDSIWIGLLIGFGFPVILYFISLEIIKWQGLFFDASFYESFSLFLIAINGLLMRYLLVNKEKENMGRGLIIATLLLAIAWVIKYHT